METSGFGVLWGRGGEPCKKVSKTFQKATDWVHVQLVLPGIKKKKMLKRKPHAQILP